MKVMLFTMATNLTEAIKLLKEKSEEEFEFSIGSNVDHSLRYIQYHLQEYDLIIIDKEIDSFKEVLFEVIDRKVGENLKTKMLIISQNISKEDLRKSLPLGDEADYEKVDYDTASWLYDLLKK